MQTRTVWWHSREGLHRFCFIRFQTGVENAQLRELSRISNIFKDSSCGKFSSPTSAKRFKKTKKIWVFRHAMNEYMCWYESYLIEDWSLYRYMDDAKMIYTGITGCYLESSGPYIQGGPYNLRQPDNAKTVSFWK